MGLSSDKEGPDPSRSSVEKTLSYAASRVFVDWPVLWGTTRDEGPVAGGGTAVGIVFELGLEADRQLGRWLNHLQYGLDLGPDTLPPLPRLRDNPL